MESWNQSKDSMMLSTNVTVDQTDSYLPVLTPIIVLALMLIAVVGNLIALMIVYRSRTLHEPSGILLANLALADLVIGLFVMPSSLLYSLIFSSVDSSVPDPNNLFPVCFCQVIGYITSFSFSMVFWTIGFITFDRSIAIFKPFTYSRLVTSRHVIILLLLLWILLSLFSAIPMLPLEAYSLGHYEYVAYYSLCWLDLINYPQNSTYVLITFFSLLAILLFVVINYLFLLLRARKTYHQIMESTLTRRRHHRLQKSTKTVTIVIGAFLIFSIPSIYISLASTLKRQYVVNPLIFRLLSIWAMYINVAINPFIFGLSHQAFKDGYFRLLGDIHGGYYCHSCKLIRWQHSNRVDPVAIPNNRYSKQSFTMETTATIN